MKGDGHHNLILLVLQIFISHAIILNNIIFKIHNNVCHLNLLFIIQLKMIHNIIKFNVHKLILITQILINHISVSNNVHQIHILHTIPLINIVLHIVPITLHKIKYNIVSIHHIVCQNISFFFKINNTV